MSGILIAAPSSGSGKTTVTLGLLRAMKRRGIAVQPGKAGPDYIDPAFHTIACGETCYNFDGWAMRPELLVAQAAVKDSLVIEAMMGLYDGSADNRGSPAQLARQLGLSVVLVVDCGRMSQSVGALVSGYAAYDPEIDVKGVILNRVGSPRHERMLRAGLERTRIPVLGVIPQDRALSLPERHLGLVQAGEIEDIDRFMDHAADVVDRTVDIDRIADLSIRGAAPVEPVACGIPPIGGRIAVARDEAFAFSYPHLLAGWRAAGAEITFFSPLADDGPDIFADAVYLPGGYPELHAGRLAANHTFRNAMKEFANRGQTVFGECGGYMVLGESIVDADGMSFPMLNLLPVATSFATRKRHLGYRRVRATGGPFAGLNFNAHEFHYATILSESPDDRLFEACDADGQDVGMLGHVRGSVSGSFMHLIDRGAS